MAKQQWTEQEKATLSNNISDGMLVSEMCKLIPNHPESGIVRVAQTLNFGVKTKDGVTKFYANKSTRNRQKETAIQIVGEPRTAPTVQEPRISEKPTKLSFGIIAHNSTKDALMAIYDDISALIESGNRTSIVSITVKSVNAEFTLNGAVHEK